MYTPIANLLRHNKNNRFTILTFGWLKPWMRIASQMWFKQETGLSDGHVLSSSICPRLEMELTSSVYCLLSPLQQHRHPSPPMLSAQRSGYQICVVRSYIKDGTIKKKITFSCQQKRLYTTVQHAMKIKNKEARAPAVSESSALYSQNMKKTLLPVPKDRGHLESRRLVHSMQVHDQGGEGNDWQVLILLQYHRKQWGCTVDCRPRRKCWTLWTCKMD